MDSVGIDLQYMRQHIEKGIKDIFAAQLAIATSKIYNRNTNRPKNRSGQLLAALSNPQYALSASNGLEMTSTLPTYIRFLDMKKHGNYQIYSRQVWGILYTETLLNIKAGYRDWLKTHFPAMLENLAK